MSARGTVVEFVGAPGAGKSVLARAMLDEPSWEARSTTHELDHQTERARRHLRRLVLCVGCLLGRPVFASGSLARLVRAGHPPWRALRMWPNLLVAVGIIDRARRRPGVEVLDQGVSQFVASASIGARRPDALAGLVPPDARADLVVRVDPGRATTLRWLDGRSGRSRADRKGADRSGFLGEFDRALDGIGSDVDVDPTEVSPAEVVSEVVSLVGDGRYDGPLRIVHVITWLDRGGAQQNTLLSIEGQMGAGHDVHLLHGTRRGDSGGLVGRAAALGATEAEVAHLRQEVHPWHDVLAILVLHRMLRRLDPDVVHTHSSKAGLLGRLAARAAGVPAIVHTVHGWSFHDQMSGWARRCVQVLERLGAAWCDATVILAESDRAKGASGRIGTPADYRLIRSGIDLRPIRAVAAVRDDVRAEVRAELGISPDVPLIGSVTRLSEQKDPLTLLAVIDRVRDTIPHAEAVVVGDGPLEDVTRQRRAELGLESCVHLLGSRSDVPRLLAAFDVFLLTSRWEGLPRVVPEAMTARVPVTASAVDGTGEIVRDGETGHLVAAGDVDGYVEAVLHQLSDADAAAEMAAAGLELVADWEAPVMVERLEELYRELLAPR